MEHSLSVQIIVITMSAMIALWSAWKLHVPSILFLLGLGFVLGPITGVVNPGLLMGDLFKPFIAACVAIILFEGSLQLNFKELKETRGAVRRIIFLGAPIGWALISIAAYYIAGLDWPVAVTLGGILVVTGPTVIMPMLRQAKLNARVGSILKWEGIVNDPVGVIFAILSYEYFVAAKSGHAGMSFFLGNGVTLVCVGVFSFVLAHVIKRLFAHGHMPEYLKTPFLLSVVLTIFFLCNMVLHESGLIAVTILGLTLANIQTSSLADIKRFKETITLMLVSGVFILLTADLDVSVILNLDWRSILFIIALLFIIRPLTFFLCSFGAKLSRQEILFCGLIAPRGIVCAAMAGVIGPLLAEAGFEDGQKILPIAFAIVIITVVLKSLMIKPLAKRLNLTSSETNGIIMVGAYAWSIQLLETLKARSVPVMLVSGDWSVLRKARLSDIPVYYGELLSEETEYALEFNKYNTLIAASENPAYNALVCEKFSHEYGSERVFRIEQEENIMSERHRISTSIQGRIFVSKDFKPSLIEEKFNEGWRFKTARVGRPDKDYDLIIPSANEDRFLVGIILKSGSVSFYVAGSSSQPMPKEDEYIIYMERDSKPQKDKAEN